MWATDSLKNPKLAHKSLIFDEHFPLQIRQDKTAPNKRRIL